MSAIHSPGQHLPNRDHDQRHLMSECVIPNSSTQTYTRRVYQFLLCDTLTLQIRSVLIGRVSYD